MTKLERMMRLDLLAIEEAKTQELFKEIAIQNENGLHSRWLKYKILFNAGDIKMKFREFIKF